MKIDKVKEHYKKTGEFLPEGYEYMFNYLLDNIQCIYDGYIKKYTDGIHPFNVEILETLNDWQVENGFTREYNTLEISDLLGDFGGNNSKDNNIGGDNERKVTNSN